MAATPLEGSTWARARNRALAGRTHSRSPSAVTSSRAQDSWLDARKVRPATNLGVVERVCRYRQGSPSVLDRDVRTRP